MKRRLLIVAAFVLAGAVVNVAVAWVITAVTTWPGWPSAGVVLTHDVEWPRSVPDHWSKRASTAQGQVFGWRLDQYQGNALEERNGEHWITEHFLINITRVGWPCYALQSEIWYDRVPADAVGTPAHFRFDGQLRRTLWLHGIPLPSARFGFGLQSWKTLPVRPIWPGCAVNTLYYAAVLWLLICGPFVVRRFVRRRRRLCAACGYPIGESGVCSECGKSPAGHREAAT